MRIQLQTVGLSRLVIEVRGHSWLIFLALVFWLVMVAYAPALDSSAELASGVARALVLTALIACSICLHEAAHIAIATCCCRVSGAHVILYPFGGIMRANSLLLQESQLLRMAAAGPLASFAIAGVFAVLWLVNGSPLFGWLTAFNAGFALFSLLPMQPLDGARLTLLPLRRWFSRARIMTMSFVVAEKASLLIVALGFITVMLQQLPAGLLLVFLGAQLEMAANEHLLDVDPRNLPILQRYTLDVLRQCRGVRVPSSTPPVSATFALPRSRASLNSSQPRMAHRTGDGASLMAPQDRDRHPSLRAWTIRPDATLGEALHQMRTSGNTTLLIVEGATITGSCTQDELLGYLSEELDARQRFDS